MMGKRSNSASARESIAKFYFWSLGQTGEFQANRRVLGQTGEFLAIGEFQA